MAGARRPRAAPPAPAAAVPAWAVALLLVALTVVAHGPAARGGFIWDDDAYVTDNATLRSADGLRRIWFEPGATPQYYPLTFTTFWLEYRLWGLSAPGYHVVNVLLHALAALLAWRVLLRLEVPGAWLATALFAVHPVHVESVAWITERKNTLSAVCYLGALLVYLRFAFARRREWPAYAVAAALFVAALLAKSVTASLPAVVVLLLWWKKPRLAWADLWPLLPLFALGAGFGLHTAWVERQHVGAVGADWDLSFVERGLIAGRALWFYAASLAWPHPLVFFYPRWTIDAGAAWQWLFPLAALAVVGALFAARARLGKGPLVAVLCFAGTVFPALGFVDVFPMRYSFVADHFQYLASLPLFALAAALLVQQAARRRLPDAALRGGAALLLALCTVLTWRQGRAYADIETLWRDTIAKNPAAWAAHSNLGLRLAQRGDLDGALAHYEAALRAKPDDDFALTNAGQALAARGDMAAAIARFEAALRVAPGNAQARLNLGNALAQEGRLDEAAEQYRAVLARQPQYADAHNNLGNVRALQGRRAEAIEHYRAALAIDPGYADAKRNLAAVEAAP